MHGIIIIYPQTICLNFELKLRGPREGTGQVGMTVGVLFVGVCVCMCVCACGL